VKRPRLLVTTSTAELGAITSVTLAARGRTVPLMTNSPLGIFAVWMVMAADAGAANRLATAAAAATACFMRAGPLGADAAVPDPASLKCDEPRPPSSFQRS